MMNYKRYPKSPTIDLKDRSWPSKEITSSPIWCSVDLRDGNQALIEPMVVSEKIEFFELLLKLGFKEIEVGFPSASQIEFNYLRQLVERDLIPEDVTIQVLVQCREHLIERTFEALEGVKKAIVHIYNSTSTLQRDVVFNKGKEEIKQIAIDGTKLVKKYAKDFPGEIRLEYSPESFSGTELDYALEVCTAVQDAWGPSEDNKIIFNLPATVEMNTPNVYADQIEWMDRNFKDRGNIILSVHPHNDRGTGVAVAELALLAGADRVEGTLFGNGERTGNVDILTLAYNMFSQGINPNLNVGNITEIIEIYERVCKLPVHERHPYAGKLVFTAFSGSHQDAINKGVKAMEERKSEIWEVPYLPIDPSDIGREYEPIVRINSQSGKGGVAFIMEYNFGYKLPKSMHKEFAEIIQVLSESKGEISPDEIMEEFNRSYLEQNDPLHFKRARIEDIDEVGDITDKNNTLVKIIYKQKGVEREFEAIGSGPIDAVKQGLQKQLGVDMKVLDYTEHALGTGATAQAAAYIHVLDVATGRDTYGVGLSSNITRASIRSVFSAVNRLYKD